MQGVNGSKNQVYVTEFGQTSSLLNTEMYGVPTSVRPNRDSPF